MVSSIQITDLTVTPVSCPLRSEVSGSTYDKGTRETIIVTIETDGDVVGRTYSGDFGDVGTDVRDTVVDCIRNRLRPVVVDSKLLTVESIWEQMITHSRRYQVWESTERWCFFHAVGAVDTALWDAVGKATQTPLYQIWGGYRDSVPIIAIGGYYEEDKGLSDLAEEMKRLQDLGVTGVKMKVGKESIEEDVERVRTVRDELGDDAVVACDANMGWDIDEAVSFAHRVKSFDLEWLEEPVHWDKQYEGMREVRLQTGVDVCAGQSESTPSGCNRLMNEQAVDVLNFDASWGGGPTAWLKAASVAETNGVSVGHHEEPHVAIHLLAAQPHGTYVECFHPRNDPVWHEMVANRPAINEGEITPPDRPGFGIELDQEFVDEYKL